MTARRRARASLALTDLEGVLLCLLARPTAPRGGVPADEAARALGLTPREAVPLVRGLRARGLLAPGPRDGWRLRATPRGRRVLAYAVDVDLKWARLWRERAVSLEARRAPAPAVADAWQRAAACLARHNAFNPAATRPSGARTFKALTRRHAPAACPFCAGRGAAVRSLRGRGYRGAYRTDRDAYAYYVRCQSCGAAGPASKSSRDAAVQQWNKRITVAPLRRAS